MAWQIYRLIFRLDTPLHVGQRGWGIIQRTRPYLMGKNLWAATTASLTRTLGSDDYKAVGRALLENALFTYFYPAVDVNQPLMPCYGDKGLSYGRQKYRELAADEFEFSFVGSYASTAIDPVTQTAEEASLHEVEVILPRTRDEGAQVYLHGYLLIHEGAQIMGHPLNISLLLDLLTDVQVGGERGYGYGRLLKHDFRPWSGKLFNQYEVENLTLTMLPDSPLPAHALIEGLLARGDIEPLTAREWGKFPPDEDLRKGQIQREGAGQVMPQPNQIAVCYVPGSVPRSVQTFEFDLDRYGILKAKGEHFA